MTLPTLDTLKKAPVLVSIVAALLIIGAWFGFDVKMPGERFDRHVQQADSIHRALDTKFQDDHAHDEVIEQMIEGMVRGECIENPIENLARQGLIPACRKLGIIQ